MRKFFVERTQILTRAGSALLFSSGEKSSNTKNYKKCRQSPSLTFPPPRSQHSCFAALAKNSHLWTVFAALVPPRRASAIPTVTSFPRNDKLYRRMRRLITFIRFNPKRTPVPPCHCEERNARRGNLPEGKTDEPYTTIPNTCPRGLPRLRQPACPQGLPAHARAGAKIFIETRAYRLAFGAKL